MPQVLAWGNTVPDKLFQLLDIREAAHILSGPDDFAVHPDFKYSACCGRERDAPDLVLKRRQQLLSHPRRAQHPTALGTIPDVDLRSACVHNLAAGNLAATLSATDQTLQIA